MSFQPHLLHCFNIIALTYSCAGLSCVKGVSAACKAIIDCLFVKRVVTNANDKKFPSTGCFVILTKRISANTKKMRKTGHLDFKYILYLLHLLPLSSDIYLVFQKSHIMWGCQSCLPCLHSCLHVYGCHLNKQSRLPVENTCCLIETVLCPIMTTYHYNLINVLLH